MRDLTQQAKLIKSRDDFIEFVKNLARHLEDLPSEQSNPNLISYLQAIAAWTGDMDGYYQNRGEDPPIEPTWRMVGEILIAALVYE